MTAAVVLTAAGFATDLRAQAPQSQLHLLDVPYLAQSEALCGGAAVAMVMRYWGAKNIYAETFSDLVDAAAGGIRGEELLRALHSRAWEALSFRGDRDLVQSHLAARRPIIALIQDRPGRFHYVVVVGWTRGRIIVHDPARAPFRVIDETAFSEAWMASGYWTLVALPPSGASAAIAPVDAADLPVVPPDLRRSERDASVTTAAPCADMVKEGIRLAGAGEPGGARRLFEIAAEDCPASPAPWRELAGLHALRSEWVDAAADARRALARDPSDPLASRILATALYLDGDPEGALDGWNHVGEPIIDLVNVTGLERIRYAVVTRTVGIQPQTLLTRRTLAAARRRLAELPSAQATRVTYRPGENGRAQVDATVLERPVVPVSYVALAAMGARAIADRELVLGIAGPSGGGEMWTAAWRFWQHRPRVAFGFAAPAPFGGIWSVDGFDERQSYADAGGVVEEARRHAGFGLSDWTRSGFRWAVGAAYDRWRSSDRTFGFTGSGQQRFAGDRAAIELRGGSWTGDVRTWTLALAAEWRSATRNERQVWIARAGEEHAGARSPLALWPGAGTGQGRDVLLRAHPLLDDGTIRGGVFGRRLTHGGMEWRRWLQPARTPVRIAPALFVDAARASRGLTSSDGRWQWDAGAGLRVAVPGAGIVRIDVARGLRDGSTALSMGWTR